VHRGLNRLRAPTYRRSSATHGSAPARSRAAKAVGLDGQGSGGQSPSPPPPFLCRSIIRA